MTKFLISFLLLLNIAFCPVNAQFAHPGMLHAKPDLDFFQAIVHSGKEPWKTAWKQLQNSELASLSFKPSPIPHVFCGPYNLPNNGGTEFYRDGNAAYTMALQWYATGNKKYAQKAIEILNAWSYTLDSVTHHNRELKIGVAGIKYLNAAEIIRHTYKGWKEKDQQAFEKMILEKWYPVIENFKPRNNGNWDAAMAQTMLCIGIFTDRKDIFEKAYHHILDGETNGSLKYYFLGTGQCQESGRDQWHVQMGLSYLGNICEIAWNQGYDLYAEFDSRLSKGYEYTSKYMLGEDVPYEQYVTFFGRTLFGEEISSSGRGKYHPIYEPVYRHYHGRKGMEMPYTGKVITTKTRNETLEPGFMPWTTLMYAGYP